MDNSLRPDVIAVRCTACSVSQRHFLAVLSITLFGVGLEQKRVFLNFGQTSYSDGDQSVTSQYLLYLVKPLLFFEIINIFETILAKAKYLSCILPKICYAEDFVSQGLMNLRKICIISIFANFSDENLFIQNRRALKIEFYDDAIRILFVSYYIGPLANREKHEANIFCTQVLF